jgi:hypothetical protein
MPNAIKTFSCPAVHLAELLMFSPVRSFRFLQPGFTLTPIKKAQSQTAMPRFGQLPNDG